MITRSKASKINPHETNVTTPPPATKKKSTDVKKKQSSQRRTLKKKQMEKLGDLAKLYRVSLLS